MPYQRLARRRAGRRGQHDTQRFALRFGQGQSVTIGCSPPVSVDLGSSPRPARIIGGKERSLEAQLLATRKQQCRIVSQNVVLWTSFYLPGGDWHPCQY